MSKYFSDEQVMEVLGPVALEKLLEHTTCGPAVPRRPHGGATTRRPKWRAHPDMDVLLGRKLEDGELRKLNRRCNGKYRTYYVDWGAKKLRRHREDWDLEGAEQAIGGVIAEADNFVADADIKRISVAYDVPAAWLRDLVKAAGFTSPVKAQLRFFGYERPCE